MVKTSVIGSPEARRMNVVLDNISDEVALWWTSDGTRRTITDEQGIFPVQYTVGLLGPLKLQVRVKASFTEQNRICCDRAGTDSFSDPFLSSEWLTVREASGRRCIALAGPRA